MLLGAYNRILSLQQSSEGLELLASPSFNTTFATTLYDINQGIVSIIDVEKKVHVKSAVSELSIRLIFELIRELEVELTEAAPYFDQIAQLACQLYGFDYNDFQEHVQLEGLVEFAQDLSGTEEANQQKRTRKNTLAWQLNERAKVELIDLIRKKRNWARLPGRWHKLFDNPGDDLHLKWNAERLEELAYLMYRLHSLEIIGCIGNRGTFSAVEKHLFDFEGNKIRKGRLKTLSHRINNNMKRYEHRLMPVNEIIEAIQEIARN